MNEHFQKRLQAAQNPRVRKHHAKPTLKPSCPQSHFASMLDELKNDSSIAMPLPKRIYHPSAAVMARNAGEVMQAAVLSTAALGIAAGMDVCDAVKQRLGKKARLEKLEKRRKYYAADALRRQKQREQVRAATPAPLHPCPTPEQLREAYLMRRENEYWKERFGTLLIDLEEYAKRTYDFSGNRFSAVSGGVKNWLKANCPLLAEHYSTCLRYKHLVQEDYAT